MKQSTRGFTLLELLVVIAIIGLLAAIVIAVLNQARVSGRDSKRVADLKEVQTALALYFDDHSTYAPTLSALVPEQLPALPGDPIGNEPYHYDLTSNGASYHLGANLETDHDALNSDFDSVSDTINGADTADCSGGDSGRYCYDVVP